MAVALKNILDVTLCLKDRSFHERPVISFRALYYFGLSSSSLGVSFARPHGLKKLLPALSVNSPYRLPAVSLAASMVCAMHHTCAGEPEGFLQVWRLPALVAVHTLRGHRRGVWAVAFSPVDQVSLKTPVLPQVRVVRLASRVACP